MFLPILIALGHIMILLGLIIENFILYPKIYTKIKKKCYKAQSIEQRNRYIQFYKKICEKENSSLFFYYVLVKIEKYGKILIKGFFLILFLQIAIVYINSKI